MSKGWFFEGRNGHASNLRFSCNKSESRRGADIAFCEWRFGDIDTVMVRTRGTARKKRDVESAVVSCVEAAAEGRRGHCTVCSYFEPADIESQIYVFELSYYYMGYKWYSWEEVIWLKRGFFICKSRGSVSRSCIAVHALSDVSKSDPSTETCPWANVDLSLLTKQQKA